MNYIKMLGENRVGGYAVIWGSETAKDFDGEFFTPGTSQLTSIFDALGKLPFLYQHGMDEKLKSAVIGEIDVMAADDVGLWYEAQLRMSDEYQAYIENLRNMVSEKRLGTSSGALPGTVTIDYETGHIKSWAIIEASATPTPADMRQITQQPLSEIKSHMKSIGVDFAALIKNAVAVAEETATENDEPTTNQPEPTPATVDINEQEQTPPVAQNVAPAAEPETEPEPDETEQLAELLAGFLDNVSEILGVREND